MASPVIIRNALLSVSDKTDLIPFAKQLHQLGISLFSTGGTAKALREACIPVTDVSDYTGFPEIMGGRVKTLHPKIHGGLLGRRNEDQAIMAEHGIMAIDLLVVNLYPFQETIAKPDCDFALAIENIDIGGPTMIRAAAKNHAAVTVVTSPDEYSHIVEELQNLEGATSDKTRRRLATQAFTHTAQYDAAISRYLTQQTQATTTETEISFPKTLQLDFHKKQDLRYGENPHQAAAFYTSTQPTAEACIANAEQLQGKALSYNNLADADAALESVKMFTEQHACVIVKHSNPCGVALADTQRRAYERAYKTDSTSAFGGIIAFNQTLQEETANAILQQQFVEVVIAPLVTPEAQKVFATKPNIRVLCCGELPKTRPNTTMIRSLQGGLLVQQRDVKITLANDVRVVTQRPPSEQEMQDLLFAWKVAQTVKSNAIVYAQYEQTLGIGAGQMSRIDSARIAAQKAGDAQLSLNQGAVMASDAFFPFRDSVDAAAKVGIAAIIQPGGSIRDEEVIAAADQAGIAMVFTGIRHFYH